MQASGAMRRENVDTYSPVIVREGGRSSIPETSMIESIGRGVLDTRRSLSSGSPKARPGGGYDDLSWCDDRGPLPQRRHRNPGAVAAAHQHAILGLAQIGDADRKPDADGGQRHGEGERGDIGEHAMTEIVAFVARPLVAGQIVRRGR